MGSDIAIGPDIIPEINIQRLLIDKTHIMFIWAGDNQAVIQTFKAFVF